jgi:molybdopterin biosynthesis enzyme
MNRKLSTFEEAKRAIEAYFKPVFLGDEETVLLEAFNRVLSEDVVSPIDIPGFNSSRLAGYAVKAADTALASEDQPVSQVVSGSLIVGETPKLTLAKGQAVEVAAGTVLPEGADAVIAIEDAEREDDTLQLYSPATIGDNLRKQGSDIKAGAVVLKKGQLLGSTEIGVLSALGYKQLKVLKIPMIAVLSIGNEVTELGKALSSGKMFDLNSYGLSTAVMECGAKPVYFGVVPEEKAAIQRVLAAAVASTDMVIACTDNPAVPEIVDLLGKPGIVVNGVAAKPGKLTAAAFIGDKPVLLLPSNPSAALLMYHLFARSLVQRLGGRPTAGLKAVNAYAGSKIFSAKGSRTFTMVQLQFDEQCRLIAEPIDATGPVSALACADGFVQIEENEQFLEVDQEVTVMLLRGSAAKA